MKRVVAKSTAFEGVAKGSEKKGTTKDTKSTKKSFSFPLCSSCPSWFEAFTLFATASFVSMTAGGFDVCGTLEGVNRLRDGSLHIPKVRVVEKPSYLINIICWCKAVHSGIFPTNVG